MGEGTGQESRHGETPHWVWGGGAPPVPTPPTPPQSFESHFEHREHGQRVKSGMFFRGYKKGASFGIPLEGSAGQTPSVVRGPQKALARPSLSRPGSWGQWGRGSRALMMASWVSSKPGGVKACTKTSLEKNFLASLLRETLGQ